MQPEILELEKLVNQEVEVYSQLEKYVLDKKECLIKRDLNRLKDVDCEIQKINMLVDKLEIKRANLNLNFGKRNMTLSEIINMIEKDDRKQAERFSAIREKLKYLATSIQRQNNINTQLIHHSLKLIEHSVKTIANVLIPESSAYNRYGKNKNIYRGQGISSVIHDA